ncbi:hypothetical protein SAMN05216486_10441 [bacterium JGI 053]|nr:hypothetical protein SAMN05216486_10441 [bacterium JGI 053]
MSQSNEVAVGEAGSDVGLEGTFHTGYFCFRNQLGGPIISGRAKHWTSDGAEAEIDLAGLANDTVSASKGFITNTGNVDHWSFKATLADGTVCHVDDKHCAFKTSDTGSTVTMSAVLQSLKGTLTINIGSGNCSENFKAV